MLKKLFPISFSKLPTPIKIIGIYFILTPIVSYIATAYKLDLPITKGKAIITSFDRLNITLNLMGFLVGFGILGVRKWGYFLFLAFNSALLIHGFYLLFHFYGVETELLNTNALIWNLIITIVPFFLILYFLNSEISTPYLTLIPRGFRKKWRTDIPLKGTLEDTQGNKLKVTTLDISPSGCLADIEGYITDEGDYTLTFDIEKEWKVNASVVRIQNENVGLHFNYNGSTDPAKKELKKYIESKLLPRYSITIPCEWKNGDKILQNDILNISEGGFYISTSELAKLGDLVTFNFKIFGVSFKGNGKISWINSESNYNKPIGMGISFSDLGKNILYKFFIFCFRVLTNFESRDR